MFNFLLVHVFTFNASYINFETYLISLSLSIFIFSFLILSSLNDDASRANFIINIQKIVYLIIVFKIYMVAHSSY